MKEKDIKITTLSDEKLLIFSPPTSINQFNKNNIPPNQNKESNNTLIHGNKGGFTYLSKVEYLGAGGFSKVYKYRGDMENKAVKKVMADPKYYSKSLTAEDSIKREVYGMTKVDCNHSLKVYGVYQNTDKNIFYILMEQCDGNIENYMKKRGYPLNINEILILLCQLNDAFFLLDKCNIIHRDIKPSNILYKEEKDINPHNKRMNKKIFEGKNMTFKIGDYGVCIPLYDKSFSKSQFMGTLDYMAPEIYEMKCEKEHPVYTKKIDLFSLGQSILWLMGFFEKANTLTKNAVDDLKKNCKLFEGNHKEKLLGDLIFNHLLIFDPEKRDGWEEYFNHPLFEEFGIIGNKEYENYTDNNSQRIKKRVIKRSNFEIKKINILFSTEKKTDVKNKLKLKINNEENNKIKINKKEFSFYKYKINTNVEKRPYVNSINNKPIINHKNTVMKNLISSDDDKNNSKEQKNKYELDKIKIEKKKTFDIPISRKLKENKSITNININENKKINQINIITNNHLNEMNPKNYISEMNKHFISIRSRYKKLSQSKNNFDIKKKLIKNTDLDDKEIKVKDEPQQKVQIKLKSSPSFVKNKKEEKKGNSIDKYSKSDKKYNYFTNNFNKIEKKRTTMEKVKFEKNKNQILNHNDNGDMGSGNQIKNNEQNKNIISLKEPNSKNNNVKVINISCNNFKNKKYTNIKVINYRIEDNKKNKNVGFYFSKYSNTRKKDIQDNTKVN